MSGTSSAPVPVSSQSPGAAPPLWRNRDFSILWVTRAVSELGTGVSSIAMPLLALAVTRSAADTGIVAAVGQAGALVPRLIAGTLADRWNRRSVMMISDLARGGLLASVGVAAALHAVTLAQLVIVAVGTGLFGALFGPAESGAMRRIVPAGQLTDAMSKNQARGFAADLAGTPLGGFLFGVGAAVPFLADAVSYGLSVAGLCFLRVPQDMSPQARRASVIRQAMDGWRFVWRQRFLRVALFALPAVNLTFPLIYLSVIFIARAHGATSAAIGVAFMFGTVTGLAGALMAPRVSKLIRPGMLLLLCVWLLAGVTVAMMYTGNVYVLGALFALVFLIAPAFDVVASAHIMQITPDDYQGRTQSAIGLVANCSAPLGYLFTGAATTAFGSRTTLLIGVILLAMTGLALAAARSVRQLSTDVTAAEAQHTT